MPVITSGFGAFSAEINDMGKRVDLATVGAMRASAQMVVKEAKTKVRVYAGDRPDVPKGRLKKSIKAGKVRRTAAGREVTVKASSFPAWAYAGRIEQMEPFMGPAERVAQSAHAEICIAAWEKAIR